VGKYSVRRIFLSCFVVIFLLFIVGCFLPIPHKIEKTLDGIQWLEGNPDYSEDKVITINGTYKKYLIPIFRDNYFSGSINISGIAYTITYTLQKIYFTLPHNTGSMWYSKYSEPQDSQVLGLISEKNLFAEIVILLSEDSFDDDKQQAVISAPSDSREKALDLALSLFGDDFGFK
jgi:hypothetical protein